DVFFFQAEDGIRDKLVTGVQTCALPIFGISGISSDLRQILSELPHNPDARLAVDVYVHRIVQTIGAMAATLGGIDALVFTAGVEIGRASCRERVECVEREVVS